jgi:hypothetical protein
MEALISSPWLERLEALHLSYADATAENLRRFALDPRFQGLEELSLRACRLGRDEVEALCAGPWPRLKALNLSHDALSPRALEPLLSHGLRARLKSFSLSGHGLGEAGLGALGARGPWSALESLEVCSTTIDGYDNSMTSQAALPHLTAEAFPALRRLSLARVQWTSEPADVLRLLAALPSLRWLHLPMAVDRSLRDELTEQAQARCCQLVFW